MTWHGPWMPRERLRSHNQEIIHIIQRIFTVDGQEGIRTPIGMHGYRLEVETHIITEINLDCRKPSPVRGRRGR